MKTETRRTDHDVTTAFGYASGGAICPPETDYPTEAWEVVVRVENKDSRQELGGLIADPKEWLAEELDSAGAIPFDRNDDDSFEIRHFAFLENGFRFTVDITGSEPCGGRGAVYEHHSWLLGR
jgi:hypothetical protein